MGYKVADDVDTTSPVSLPQEAQLLSRPWGFVGQFRAMASPCELLIASANKAIASEILAIAINEARRIEAKYSRFITHNPLWHINHSDSVPVSIDDETYRLLMFAQQCFELSDGRFDITAGPLMQLWRFENGENARLPDDDAILAAKALVDFSTITFSTSTIVMPSKMNLDLGGIAKEYAVDSSANLIANRWPKLSVLVNFGGDIACPVARDNQNPPWQIGIENPNDLDNASAVLQIRQGALATSGDTRRFIERDGRRYGHIIDPNTGFPVEHAPRSVTVLAQNCVMAGMLSTMAMLEGCNAESFLNAQGVYYKIYR